MKYLKNTGLKMQKMLNAAVLLGIIILRGSDTLEIKKGYIVFVLSAMIGMFIIFKLKRI